MYNETFNTIIEKYKSLDEVEAIAIGGSTAAKTSDKISDTDIYVFVSRNIPLDIRNNIVTPVSSKYEVGGEYFGAGDEYFVDKLNRQLDIMFWNKNWFEEVVDNVWIKHYPSNGYTTCFLYTLKNFEIIYDKDNWLGALRGKIMTSYPKTLKYNIIKRNMMLLKDKPFASYYEQIRSAIKRNDIVSVNHRIAAFLASYFDILFALNEMLHPGEKRLIAYVKNNCKIIPKDFEENITNLLKHPAENTLDSLDMLIDNLKDVI